MPQGTSAHKKAWRPVDSDKDDKEVEELVLHPLEEVTTSHVNALGMLTKSLNLLIMKMVESNAQREWVERQRLERERERLEIDWRRLELDEVEKKWRALAWEMEMEEKKPGLLAKKRMEFIQGSSRDGRAQVEEVEESEEDDDKEMGSDEAGGEAEVQVEMGVTLPPSQPPFVA